MPKDYTPAARRIETQPTQSRRADDPQALAELEQILTDELAPATPIAAMLARDLVQLEVDIVKLRQARRDIEGQALAEQVRAAFRRNADLTFKIDERLEKMEKRRRLLRRDYDVFASDQAQLIEPPK